MKSLDRRPKRRLRTELPQLLPPDEWDARVVEQLQPRVDRYVANHNRPEWKALNSETAVIAAEVESAHARVAVLSRKKRIPEGQANGLEPFQLKYADDRCNEDVVRAGENWYVLADGITNHEKNVCGLMGEAIAIAAEHVFSELDARMPHPDEATIVEAMRSIPTLARTTVQTELQKNEEYRDAVRHYTLLDTDFSTTVELVYYAPWLERAFILHIGDSRTYVVASDGTAKQATRDHSEYDPVRTRSFISSSFGLDASRPDVDVFSVPLLVGERVVSITDGVFAHQESGAVGVGVPSVVKKAIQRRSREYEELPKLLESLVDNGEQFQDSARLWDDTSGAALERTA